MAPFAGPTAMTFFAQLSVRTVVPPLAAALGSMGAVLAVSTLATVAGAERWAMLPKGLPVEAAPEPAPVLRGAKSVPVSERPGERRTVRIIYQGYGLYGPSK